MNCLFSAEITNTREHVIPQWLQRRFSLQEQTIWIPNGTQLKYKHLTVPAAKAHNARFGEIENRLSQGEYRLDEVYLWALKLHIGLIFRDGSLRLDITNPNSPPILRVGDFNSEVAFFRMLYSLWCDEGTTNPLPLGSVYVLDSLLPSDQFDFFHCLITGTVGIHIGGKFIVVFLWDQGEALASNIEWIWREAFLSRMENIPVNEDSENHGYMAHHIWACESAYFLYRHRRSFNFFKSDKDLVLIPPLNRLPPKDTDEKLYRSICRSFGLDLSSFNSEMIGNVYSPLSFENQKKHDLK